MDLKIRETKEFGLVRKCHPCFATSNSAINTERLSKLGGEITGTSYILDNKLRKAPSKGAVLCLTVREKKGIGNDFFRGLATIPLIFQFLIFKYAFKEN